jgi:hypothetical protein
MGKDEKNVIGASRATMRTLHRLAKVAQIWRSGSRLQSIRTHSRHLDESAIRTEPHFLG